MCFSNFLAESLSNFIVYVFDQSLKRKVTFNIIILSRTQYWKGQIIHFFVKAGKKEKHPCVADIYWILILGAGHNCQCNTVSNCMLAEHKFTDISIFS